MGTSSRWAAGSAGDDIVTSSLRCSHPSAPRGRSRGISGPPAGRTGPAPAGTAGTVRTARPAGTATNTQPPSPPGRTIAGRARPPGYRECSVLPEVLSGSYFAEGDSGEGGPVGGRQLQPLDL